MNWFVAEADPEKHESVDLLLVDDDPRDLHAAAMFLKRRPEPFSIEMAAGAQAGLAELETDARSTAS